MDKSKAHEFGNNTGQATKKHTYCTNKLGFKIVFRIMNIGVAEWG
jgi:hypothetical protein